jgi:MIP family channel proteins
MSPTALLAEFLGTFMLVFAICGTASMVGPEAGGVVALALAHAFALAAVIWVWGPVSGAHVNPAVTFAMALRGRIRWPAAAGYWVAQCLGAILAAAVLAWLVGTGTGLGASTGTLTQAQPLRTAILEAVLTFFLVLTVFGTAVAGRGGNAAPLAIGLALGAGVLVGAVPTGASMNPARTLGPALVLGDLARPGSYMWIYVVGPFAGAALAALASRVTGRSGSPQAGARSE